MAPRPLFLLAVNLFFFLFHVMAVFPNHLPQSFSLVRYLKVYASLSPLFLFCGSHLSHSALILFWLCHSLGSLSLLSTRLWWPYSLSLSLLCSVFTVYCPSHVVLPHIICLFLCLFTLLFSCHIKSVSCIEAILTCWWRKDSLKFFSCTLTGGGHPSSGFSISPTPSPDS